VKIPLLSFFTGGGFLDIGFEKAGFAIKWTNEVKPEFADIYASGVTSWRRSRNPKPRKAAIANTNSIASLEDRAVMRQAFGNKAPPLFGAIGGPPCTDFSPGGLHAGHNGDNGQLTGVYVEMLKSIKPSFFLLENVPHLASHPDHGPVFESLLKKLSRAGYVYVRKKLNALDFGIPQDRTRLFVIGFRRNLLRAWYPKERSPKRAFELHFRWPTPAYPNAKEAYTWPEASAFGGNPAKPRDIPEKLYVHRALKPSPESLPNGKEWFVPKSKKFKTIREGDVSGKSFKRLHRFRYAPTAWYGNNEVHLHPFKPRRLSVREAMRLQAVPDSYVMPKETPLSAKFKVICNGVPVLLAEKIAGSMASFISASLKNRKARQPSTAYNRKNGR
jgi:DNA (cytosine-5)-methyltransferase 1